MNSTRYRPFFAVFIVCCLSMLITACGATTTKPGVSSSPTARPVSTTAAGSLPPLSTSCPAQGTARAAVMPPLVLGSHQNIVYLKYQGGIQTTPPTTLLRYDVTTGSTTEIVQMPNVRIAEAQVSADGQWILFVAGSKLQLIRMDGQELQTLYCTATYIINVQWSPDQRHIIFSGGGQPTGEQALYLLDLTRGTVQPELVYTDPSTRYLPRTWVDAKRVYLVGYSVSVPKLYILDTTTGANQQTKNLQLVAQAQSPNCWDFDSSYDSGKLFIDHCIQLVSLGSGGAGSGLTRLSAEHAGDHTSLNRDTQYPWSNFSHDGSMYAARMLTVQDNAATYALFFGALRGGTPTTFATLSQPGEGAELEVVGWTTM